MHTRPTKISTNEQGIAQEPTQILVATGKVGAKHSQEHVRRRRTHVKPRVCTCARSQPRSRLARGARTTHVMAYASCICTWLPLRCVK